MADEIKPHFSTGWYDFHEEEIRVALDAILHPETMPRESHFQYERQKMKASPIVDKTLLLGVTIDLVHHLWYGLVKAEDQIRELQLRLQGLDTSTADDANAIHHDDASLYPGELEQMRRPE